MPKEKAIELTGTVVETKPGTKFIVEVQEGDSKFQVLATLCGKMHQHFIRVLLGDTVRIEVSPYDLTRGRIVFRDK